MRVLLDGAASRSSSCAPRAIGYEILKVLLGKRVIPHLSVNQAILGGLVVKVDD